MMESEQRRARDEEECLGRINNKLVADRVKEMMLSDDVHDVISRRHTNTSLFPLVLTTDILRVGTVLVRTEERWCFTQSRHKNSFQ
jgi:hypothetical protein